MNVLTCVSCYYKIKNKHGDKYNDWFKNTLSINVPYVFFSDAPGIEYIKLFRGNLPTVYIECEIESFYGYKYHDIIKTDPHNCPSVELKMIWNEKVFFLEKASELNPFHSEWFQWIDAGVCVYRDNPPPPDKVYPNISKLEQFPNNKLLFSSSLPWNENLVKVGNYYHHVSGTSYILHKSFINTFVGVYKIYLEKLVGEYNIWTDQDILTHIFKDNRDMFIHICHGYGEIVPFFF
jgi:hypothetical protein